MELTAGELERLREINPELGAALVAKLRKATAPAEPAYISSLFPEQKAFVRDPAKKKAALCSRRAGKTEGVAAWLLEGGFESPGELSVYIALSRNNCRLILWRTLEAINRRHNLGLWFKELDGQLIVELPNQHRIWLAGCKDSAEVEKFRGVKIWRAAIDEAASYGEYLRELIFDVLEPALLDHDGSLALIGTPGAIPAGVFFEATMGESYGQQTQRWSTHSWTVLDNVYVPHAKEWLALKRKENNWDETHPTYQREWLGRWVKDEGALVYPFGAEKNVYYDLPADASPKDFRYCLGVDVGYEDSTAFVVGAYRRGHPDIWICYVEKRKHLIPSAVAAHMERLRREYGCFQIVMDTGGLGKAYAEEAHQRYGIYCEPAEKRKKRAFIEIVRGELMSGNIKIHPMHCRDLLDEMVRLVWDEKREEPDDRFEDHACDAFLYLVRSIMPSYRPEIERNPPSTEEALAAEMAGHRAAALKQIKEGLRRKMRTGDAFRKIASGER